MPVRGNKFSQGRTAAQSAAPYDAFNPPPGQSVITHGPEVQGIRDAAAVVRQRAESGLPPEGSRAARQAPEPPSADPLPFAHVARQVAAREIARLSSQAESGRRELANRFTFTWSGQQVSDPAVIAMRAELTAQVEAAEAEAGRLGAMTDDQVRAWAAKRGWH